MRAFTLVITAIALAFLITPALAADMTIPINKDFKEGDMVVHLLQVSITDSSTGNVYSPDPANTVWPKLVFTYENMGNVPINGDLEIAFFDENGKQYPESKRITDITMNPIGPGNASEVRFVEAAVVPKGTKITHFNIYWEGKATTFTIPYPDAATVTATPAATAGQGTGSGPCAIAVLLAILAIGVFLGGKIKR